MGRDSQKKGFVLGAFLGGVAGGLAALLFAPKPGKELRKDITKKYGEASDKTKEMIDCLCDHASDLAEKAKEIAEDAKDLLKK